MHTRHITMGLCLCAQHVYILGIMTCTHQVQAAHDSDKRVTWGGGGGGEEIAVGGILGNV